MHNCSYFQKKLISDVIWQKKLQPHHFFRASSKVSDFLFIKNVPHHWWLFLQRQGRLQVYRPAYQNCFISCILKVWRSFWPIFYLEMVHTYTYMLKQYIVVIHLVASHSPILNISTLLPTPTSSILSSLISLLKNKV